MEGVGPGGGEAGGGLGGTLREAALLQEGKGLDPMFFVQLPEGLRQFLAITQGREERGGGIALEQAEQLSINWIWRRIPDFYVYSQLYEPELTLDTLSDDKTTRMKQLWQEANRMRNRLQGMVDELKVMSKNQ